VSRRAQEGEILSGWKGVSFTGVRVLLVPKPREIQEAIFVGWITTTDKSRKRRQTESIEAFGTADRSRSASEGDGRDGVMYMLGGGGGEYTHNAPTNPAQHAFCLTAAQPRHQAMDLDNNPIKCLATNSAMERYQELAVLGRLMSAEKRKLKCPEWLLQLPKLAQLLEKCRSARPEGNMGGNFNSFLGVKDLDKMGVMVKGVQ
jgi:hypothetical protein